MVPGREEESEPESASDLRLITQVLAAAGRGRPEAAEELLPLVYAELRRLAQSRLQGLDPGQTLQATALVHEVWMRLLGDGDPGWDCRAHFFGAAAKAMRNILVEQHRRKGTLKRGGRRADLEPESLTGEDTGELEGPVDDLLALDEVLDRLAERDPLKARIVELRFFTGMTVPEVARTLELSLSKVEREWRFTRAWLQREMESRGTRGVERDGAGPG